MCQVYSAELNEEISRCGLSDYHCVFSLICRPECVFNKPNRSDQINLYLFNFSCRIIEVMVPLLAWCDIWTVSQLKEDNRRKKGKVIFETSVTQSGVSCVQSPESVLLTRQQPNHFLIYFNLLQLSKCSGDGRHYFSSSRK